jgi:YjbE family integral membrane protein
MTEVLAWFATLDWDAILQIILIDILLGGDNAVIIALACRNLPARQRRVGIIWGAAGAIVLRVILITVAVALLQVPFLKLVGGLLLLWIGVKLIAPADGGGHSAEKLHGSDRLLAAIKTIIVADFVMSLDNVIAIAGAAEQADPAHRTGLIVFGLLVSVPFIVFGAQIILKLLDRFPIIVTAGAALLGWIAGGLIVGDPILQPVLPASRALYYAACIAGATFVVLAGRWLARRRAATGVPAAH